MGAKVLFLLTYIAVCVACHQPYDILGNCIVGEARCQVCPLKKTVRIQDEIYGPVCCNNCRKMEAQVVYGLAIKGKVSVTCHCVVMLY